MMIFWEEKNAFSISCILFFHVILESSSVASKLDKTKFYLVGAGIFSGVTVALYPISVVKTRLQVASHESIERSAVSVIKGLLKTDGIPGLYKGFGTVVTGAIPTRVIFLTALETTKAAAFKMVEPFKLSEPTQAAIANGVAGMMASLCSQAVFVPVDVLSSGGLVMVQANASSGDHLLHIEFCQVQRLLDDGIAPSEEKIMAVQAAGGIFAAATASCITTPMDTIKTRLQVMGHAKRLSTRQVVKSLIADDGWTGFYRGLGPRFFSMSAWGTSMILAYEYLTDSSPN
ncbi:Mitochondrial RNA-splicing protein MRS3 [Sesamum angolense]|uniref:Mitochondrial RNA-splicing protein MRS3 n=1 Tax=Sesamum angolense TaxID=2727404 RepID=A0AAE1XE79_9LAMI|nr:Mitochondrial RNA-splicing protein MRS3 [Sesamum angolense]